jgi:MoaA/NifB/PqqE/SkfB family radical SAM enzyme
MPPFYSLEPQRLDVAEIEFTSSCNLRCTYCAVSGPDYKSIDLPADRYLEIFDHLNSVGVGMVQINGHGETTNMKGWMDAVRPFVLNFDCKMICNFARELTREETEFLCDVKLFHVSIDTAEAATLRKIRRKVTPDDIAGNILRIRSAALRLNKPSPQFNFISGIYDKNVFQLPDLVRFAATLGISSFHFWGLWKHRDIKGATNVYTIDELPDADQPRALECIDEAFDLLKTYGIPYHVSGDFVEVFRKKVRSQVAA